MRTNGDFDVRTDTSVTTVDTHTEGESTRTSSTVSIGPLSKGIALPLSASPSSSSTTGFVNY